MKTFFTWIFFCFSTALIAGTPPGIRFVENKNQWYNTIHYRAEVGQGHADFYHDKIQFIFRERARRQDANGKRVTSDSNQSSESGPHHHTPSNQFHAFDVRFVNANPAVTITGEEKLVTQYNYFLGDRRQWASNVSSFEKIHYRELYKGIDLVYYSHTGHLKYEWVVAPQTDPSVIITEYVGVDQLNLENQNIYIRTSVNELWEMKPFAYQVKGGKQVVVPCEYKLVGNTLRYQFPEGYDECEPLIIDPILIFSAYSGSTQDNWGNTATYDSRGNVYSGGMVENLVNLHYPVTPGAFQRQHGGGAWDIGILKYDSAGSKLLYCTYIGGADTETPQSLVVNNDDELLILGATSSNNFPVTNGSKFIGGPFIEPLWGVPYNNGTDIFVTRLSEDGSQLLGSTYLGGAENDGVNFVSGSAVGIDPRVESQLCRNYGDELRGDVITDANNFVYIASNVRSSDFPIVGTGTSYNGGTHDAVVVKLKPDLSEIVWSRFIGGNNTDAAYSLKLDQANTLFVAGGTMSPAINGMNGFRTFNTGNIDGWVMSLNQNGSVLNGTFVGTPQYDQCYFVDLDQHGDVFLYGQTRGDYHISKRKNVFNTPRSGQFIQKLSHTLRDTLFSTVVGTGGNNPNISPTAFLVSDCGYLYLSGWGGVTNATTIQVTVNNRPVLVTRNYVGGSTRRLRVTPDAYQPNTSGNDFYFMVLSSDATQFLYGTFLGGDESATHVDGGTSRFDKQGIVYHAVCAGCGGFSDFPAENVPDLHQINRSENCNNAVFKFDLSLLKARVRTNSVALDMPGLDKVCMPDKIVFENRSSGGKTFEWNMDDGTHITKTDITPVIHEYKQPGSYMVWLKAIDAGTCKVVDSTSVTVHVFTKEATIQDDDELCRDTEYTLRADGGATYSWISDDGSFESNQQYPVVKPADTTTYYVTITEASGCAYKDSVTLNVIPLIEPAFEMESIQDCSSLPAVSVKNLTDGLWADDKLYFDFGDGTQEDGEEIMHVYEEEGKYPVKLVSVREAGNAVCVIEKVVTIPAYALIIPNVITPDDSPGQNDSFIIQYGKTKGHSPFDEGFTVSLKIVNRWGEKLFEAADYRNDWKGTGLATGVYFYEVTVQNLSTCKGWIHLVK